jgi:hypothetical protein
LLEEPSLELPLCTNQRGHSHAGVAPSIGGEHLTDGVGISRQDEGHAPRDGGRRDVNELAARHQEQSRGVQVSQTMPR